MPIPLVAILAATAAANFASGEVNRKKDEEEARLEKARNASTYRKAKSIDIAQEVGSRLSRRRVEDEFEDREY